MKAFSIALLILALASPARSASIGVFATPDCSSTALWLPINQLATIYIAFTGVTTTPGFAEYGLAAAEFQVVGLPPEWLYQAFPTPAANVSLGFPMAGGADIAFDTAQTQDCVLLYSVFLIATTSANDVVLQVKAHNTPFNPNYPCPLGIPYDPPVYGGIQCVGGANLLINSSQPIGVQPSSWSAVKRLFD